MHRSNTPNKKTRFDRPSRDNRDNYQNPKTLDELTNIWFDGMDENLVSEMRLHFVNALKQDNAGILAKPTITYDDIKYSLPYTASQKIPRTSEHIGQLKLWVSEIQFLTQNTTPDEDWYVVYAGAAPGKHDTELSNMFPRCKFLLVDPNEFDVDGQTDMIRSNELNAESYSLAEAETMVERYFDSKEKICIINAYFIRELGVAIGNAAKSRNLSDKLLFISDVRSNIHSNGEQDLVDGQVVVDKTKDRSPDAVDILFNYALTTAWCIAMEPRMSMIKFRHPFYSENADYVNLMMAQPALAGAFASAKNGQHPIDLEPGETAPATSGIDYIKNYGKHQLVFFDGTIYNQVFQGRSSTESRLWTDCKTIKNWGTPTEYDNKYYFYNNIDRTYTLHENDCADVLGPVKLTNDFTQLPTGYRWRDNDIIGSCYCNDCSITVSVLHAYWKKFPGGTVGNIRQFLMKIATGTYGRGLLRGSHGRFYGPPTLKQLGYAASVRDKMTDKSGVTFYHHTDKHPGIIAGKKLVAEQPRGKYNGTRYGHKKPNEQNTNAENTKVLDGTTLYSTKQKITRGGRDERHREKQPREEQPREEQPSDHDDINGNFVVEHPIVRRNWKFFDDLL